MSLSLEGKEMRNLQERLRRLTGIYELDEAGKVQVFLPEDETTAALSENFVGKNICDVIERLIEEKSFRSKLQSFLDGHNSVESHNLNCFKQDEIFQIRIMLARRSADSSQTDVKKSILLYFQQS
jgi:hypothetical protein